MMYSLSLINPYEYFVLQTAKTDSHEDRIGQIYQDQQRRQFSLLCPERPHRALKAVVLVLKPMDSEIAVQPKASSSPVQKLYQADNITDFIEICHSSYSKIRNIDLVRALQYHMNFSKKNGFMQETKADTVKILTHIFTKRLAKFSFSELRQLILAFSSFHYKDTKHLMGEIAMALVSSMPVRTYAQIKEILSFFKETSCNVPYSMYEIVLQSVAIRLRFDTKFFSVSEILSLLDLSFSVAKKKQQLKDLVEHLMHYFLQTKPYLSKGALLKLWGMYCFMHEHQYAQVKEMLQWLETQQLEQAFLFPYP